MSTLYIDESKTKGYTLVAALAAPADTGKLARGVRSLLLPGQRRIHFTKENSSRKRLVLSRLNELGAQAHVFHCAAKNNSIGRETCLIGLVAHAAQNSHTKIVLERDESIEKSDRQILFREAKMHGLDGTLSYAHESPHQQPLLWVADAIAWSFTKGGDWKRRADPLISGVTTLRA